jgi:4'-phosphopantetheinyl transferase
VGTEVWWANRADYRDELTGLLDEVETQRFSGYRKNEDKQRFAVGCALAKWAAARRLGTSPSVVKFDRTCGECGRTHGKPRVDGVELSVSHSGDAVLVAVADAPCGADVEQLDSDRDVAGLSRLVLGDGEQAKDEREFVRAWTRKEAVTKATGDGLSVPFSQVIVAGDPPRVRSWPYPGPPDRVTLLDLDAPDGYLAALAVLGPVTDISVHDDAWPLRPGRELPTEGREAVPGNNAWI